MIFPGAAIVAIGNRAWGSGAAPHWVGAIIMALGLWIQAAYSAFYLPAFLAAVYLYRVWSSAAWLNIQSSYAWFKAALRTVPLLGIMAVKFFFSPDAWILFWGLGSIAIFIPASYYFGGRQNKYDGTAIGELVSGLCIGLI